MHEIRILDLITWGVLIAGWFIFDLLARRRESKNSLSQRAADAIILVEKIEEYSIEFWINPGSNENSQYLQRTNMIQKLDHLERRVEDLRKQKSKLMLDNKFNNFSKSILDGNGEAVDRKPLIEGDPRMTRITVSAKELVQALNFSRN